MKESWYFVYIFFIAGFKGNNINRLNNKMEAVLLTVIHSHIFSVR